MLDFCGGDESYAFEFLFLLLELEVSNDRSSGFDLTSMSFLFLGSWRRFSNNLKMTKVLA